MREKRFKSFDQHENVVENEVEVARNSEGQKMLDEYLRDSEVFDDEMDEERKKLEQEGLSRKEARERILNLEAKFVEGYVGKLIEERDPATKIFKTMRGSVYFHFKDGTTIRFKKPSSELVGKSLMVQHPTLKLVFVSKEEAVRLKEFDGVLAGREIETIDMQEGALPLEIGLIEQGDRYPVVRETKNGILFEGTRNVESNGDIDKDDSPPYHLGNAIKEIL